MLTDSHTLKLLAAIILLMPGLSCSTFAQVTDPISSVGGTSWAGIVNTPDASGKFQDYAYEFEFLDGNKLRWRWRGTVYVNGTWQQKGQEILLEMIDNRSTWRGTIEGDRMVGSSLNNQGYKWDWGFASPNSSTSRFNPGYPDFGEMGQILLNFGRFFRSNAGGTENHGAGAYH